ncbi:MAG: sirohydrochlorin cobaltochelatase [Syntrophobacterales bacterium]
MRIRMIMKAIVPLVLVSLALPKSPIYAHGEKGSMKKGILLVAFGSTIPEAQVSFENIDRSVRKAFPGVEVYWAYTSRTIIAKMAKEGKHLVTPVEALARMMREKFTHVAVQSLHVIPGAEFHGLVQNVRRFEGMSKGMEQVLVGYPLLATSEDLRRVAEAMLKVIPSERKANDAVVFMGHGTHHPADVYYAALNYHVQKMDPNIFVGTVEGWPEIDDMIGELKKEGLKKAYLMPFMSVAGDHARNDMAGPEEDSWKSILEKEGITCEPVLKGMAEYPEFVEMWVEFVEMWVDHLKTVFSHFP